MAAHYGLSTTRLKELDSLSSLEEILAALPDNLKRDLRDAPGIPEVFSRMESAAAKEAMKVLHSSSPAITRAFAYLILRERDLRAVRAILRGRHLGLPSPMIGQALGRIAEGGL